MSRSACPTASPKAIRSGASVSRSSSTSSIGSRNSTLDLGRRPMRLSAIILMLAVWAAPARAQVHTGRIDVSVFDLTGAVLPGSAVDISGPQAQTETTDTHGEAHFLNLA